MPTPNQPQPQAEPETVDITQTWEGSMRFYFSVLESTQPQKKSRAIIHADLLKLARWADKRKKQENTAVAATVAVAVEEIKGLTHDLAYLQAKRRSRLTGADPVQVAVWEAKAEQYIQEATARIQAAAKGSQA